MTPTLSRLLAHHAQCHPQRIALRFERRDYSFAELQRKVNQLANALTDCGLVKGDKVATVLPNGLELFCAYLAAAVGGFVIVPCSTLLQPSGLENLLRDSHSKLVISGSEHADAINSIRAKLEIDDARYILSDGEHTGFQSYKKFTAAASSDDPATPVTGEDAFNIMYSSGTTGEPKGIVHSHYVRSMYCTLFADAWRMTPQSVVLHSGALVFNGAMLLFMPWLHLGCQFVLHARFDAEQFINEIAEQKVTHVMLVPAQIIAILNSPNFTPEKLASLEMFGSVGAPLHLEYKQRICELLPNKYYELYGVTEGFMVILDKTDTPEKIQSVGCPAGFTEVCIRDEQDHACPTGSIGEICGRGPLLMPGYYNQPELTARAIYNGWLHSGDLGYMDEDGFVFLVERKKDMIISGGANVYPRDIEEIVIRHPAVQEVAVFGVANEKWGEVPVAAVILRETGAVDSAGLVEWVNARVDAKFQRLADVFILDKFPRNVAGKILKRELRETYSGE